MTADKRLRQIHNRLAPLRAALLKHPIYRGMNSLPRLRAFMQQHVFAVWDFMSLLKSLQRQLCGVGLPWLPPADPLLARFVNAIVLGEESDGDGAGGYASHFELYHRAMRGCGADTGLIDRFLQELRDSRSIDAALSRDELPGGVRAFVRQTFDVIAGGDLAAIAAAFTFGREDLLPDVFERIVEELQVESGGGLADFLYYLHRHIEIDGGEHGPLAARLVTSLCGDDPHRWETAEAAAVASLQSRLSLWNGMYEALKAIPA